MPKSARSPFVFTLLLAGLAASVQPAFAADDADPLKVVKANVPIVIKETKTLEGLHKQAIELANKIKAAAEKRHVAMAAVSHAMDQIVSADDKTEAELDKHLEEMGKILESEAKVLVAFNKAMDEARHISDH